MRTAMVGLIGVSLLFTEPVEALVMCQKKSGAVFVRATCKKKETTLDLAALGLQGPPGTPGDPGPPGPPGPFPTMLPSGRTIRGVYRASRIMSIPITDTHAFLYPLASPPTVTVIPVSGIPTAACPGSPTDPQATPGNLCIYEVAGGGFLCVISPETNLGCFQSGTAGFSLELQSDADSFSTGTWAVTAP